MSGKEARERRKEVRMRVSVSAAVGGGILVVGSGGGGWVCPVCGDNSMCLRASAGEQ